MSHSPFDDINKDRSALPSHHPKAKTTPRSTLKVLPQVVLTIRNAPMPPLFTTSTTCAASWWEVGRGRKCLGWTWPFTTRSRLAWLRPWSISQDWIPCVGPSFIPRWVSVQVPEADECFVWHESEIMRVYLWGRPSKVSPRNMNCKASAWRSPFHLYVWVRLTSLTSMNNVQLF